MLGLILRRRDDKRNRVAQFHDVVDKDFNVVGTRSLEFDLAKKGHVGRVERHIFESELHLAFSQNGRLIRRDQSHGFGETAHTRRPTIEQAEPQRNDWNLRDANEVHHSDEKEIAGDFLANFFAEQGALKVRKNAGGVH